MPLATFASVFTVTENHPVFFLFRYVRTSHFREADIQLRYFDYFTAALRLVVSSTPIKKCAIPGVTFTEKRIADAIHQYYFMREGISLTVPLIYNKTSFVKGVL